MQRWTLVFESCKLLGKEKDDSGVATGVNYGVASFSSWSKSGCNLDTGIMRIIEPPTTAAFYQRLTPWMGADKPAGTYLPQGQDLGHPSEYCSGKFRPKEA